MKKLSLIAVALASVAVLSGCMDDDATIASANLSKDADNFRVYRRVTFTNTISDKVLLEVVGRCSLDASSERKVSITCKDDKGEYLKHYMGLSETVTYVVEQLQASSVSIYHYKLTYKPEAIIPDIDVKTSIGG